MTDPGLRRVMGRSARTMDEVDSATEIERRPPAPLPAPRPAGERSDTRIWWNLANAIDLLHFPFLIAMVLLGAIYFSGTVIVFLITLMVTLQIAVLGCPVMWLTGQLRKVHDPDYEVKWSFTAWLYHRYGRLFGIAVFCFFGGLTLLLRWWLF